MWVMLQRLGKEQAISASNMCDSDWELKCIPIIIQFFREMYGAVFVT